ncbi:hypothetical protein SAMN02745945_00326 [Peptoclostridium litorale DSM 5388]|uniref:Uncharacterized protein n=1 Tax=Peptoclostridium litorale DSM 5388 TaxID=1121324 RepID=A0A069RHZ6_PEPLI|nr:hypothetical protein [Peptoclostridium litorale]KDR96433.1 hypothetical protein CLIT_2c00390 [Peptoclostridium litorale DSM 5388]SIN70648.1 hypothetical protein SAMN02745945_00326 [Peptoclostridium litorale DSM 5388]
MNKTIEQNEESRPYIVVDVVDNKINLSDIQNALLIETLNKRTIVSKTIPFKSILQIFSRNKNI